MLGRTSDPRRNLRTGSLGRMNLTAGRAMLELKPCWLALARWGEPAGRDAHMLPDGTRRCCLEGCAGAAEVDARKQPRWTPVSSRAGSAGDARAVRTRRCAGVRAGLCGCARGCAGVRAACGADVLF